MLAVTPGNRPQSTIQFLMEDSELRVRNTPDLSVSLAHPENEMESLILSASDRSPSKGDTDIIPDSSEGADAAAATVPKFELLSRKLVWLSLLMPFSSIVLPYLLLGSTGMCIDGERGAGYMYALVEPVPTSTCERTVIVTAVSANYFARVKNLIGSLHFWEPGQRIIAFDIGLTERQVMEMQCWRDVELRKFDFSKYPVHVRNMYTYAWKPLLIAEVFEDAQSPECLLYFDSGVEVRQPLLPLKQLMLRDGFVSAKQSNFVGLKSHPDTLKWLHVTQESMIDKPFCAGSLMGFVRGKIAQTQILSRAVECALHEECIAPVGSGRENHNYDQSVWSPLLYQNGLSCQERDVFAEERIWMVTSDETRHNKVVIMLRRWQKPRPYGKWIRTRDICPNTMPYEAEQGGVENYQAAWVTSDSPLQKCLRENGNNEPMVACKTLIEERKQQGKSNIWPSVQAYLRLAYARVYKLVNCNEIMLLTAMIGLVHAYLLFKLRKGEAPV